MPIVHHTNQPDTCLQVVATCSKHHTEVSLVSDFSSSLSFWSLLPLPSMSQSLHGSMSKSGQEMTQHGMSHHRMSQPQLPPQPPVRDVQYNSEQTYVAVIVSDGDNMQVSDFPPLQMAKHASGSKSYTSSLLFCTAKAQALCTNA